MTVTRNRAAVVSRALLLAGLWMVALGRVVRTLRAPSDDYMKKNCQ